jgi:hypothetical protein
MGTEPRLVPLQHVPPAAQHCFFFPLPQHVSPVEQHFRPQHCSSLQHLRFAHCRLPFLQTHFPFLHALVGGQQMVLALNGSGQHSYPAWQHLSRQQLSPALQQKSATPVYPEQETTPSGLGTQMGYTLPSAAVEVPQL